MVERRKPLLLCPNEAVLSTFLSTPSYGAPIFPDLHLQAGILRLPNDPAVVWDERFASFDLSALVGISTSLLKRLRITSGSLVIVRDAGTNEQSIGQVVALDPPASAKDNTSRSNIDNVVFPSHNYIVNQNLLLDDEVAFISPMLAFNIGLHFSLFKSIVCQEIYAVESLFEIKSGMEKNCEWSRKPGMSIKLEALTQRPKYASNLRISFVDTPECGTLESLKENSYSEDEERQKLIDSELHKYFEIDRYLSRGHIFSVHINWNCKSPVCTSCTKRGRNYIRDIIYFKVMVMEPLEETSLRANCSHTTLILGATVQSPLPPSFLISGLEINLPIQYGIMKELAATIAPALYYSSFSSKFKVAIILHGLPGSGKRGVVKHVARSLGMNLVEYSCRSLMASTEIAASAVAKAFRKASRISPAMLLLHQFDVFRDLGSSDGISNNMGVLCEVASVLREFTNTQEVKRKNGNQVILVALANSVDGLPPTIRCCFSHEVKMDPLNEEQRGEMFSQLLQNVPDLLSDV